MGNSDNKQLYGLLITDEDRKIAYGNAIRNNPLRSHYVTQAKVLLGALFVTMGSAVVIITTQVLFWAILLILVLIGLCFVIALVGFIMLKIQIPKIKPDQTEIDAELNRIFCSKGVQKLGDELYINSKLVKKGGIY